MSVNPYRVAHGLTFVPAAEYDELRAALERVTAAYKAVESVIPPELRDRAVFTPVEIETILERAGLLPTGEACEAFRLGIAEGRRQAATPVTTSTGTTATVHWNCKCGGNCKCQTT